MQPQTRRAMRSARRTTSLAKPGIFQMKEGGAAQPSPSLRAAINSGFRFLRVQCSGCKQRAYVDLAGIRRPPGTSIWRLEKLLACDLCRAKNNRAPRATLELLTREASPGV